MELGAEGIRQRLVIVQKKLNRGLAGLRVHDETVARVPKSDVLELDRVRFEVALLRDVETLGILLNQLVGAARESLGDLTSLDLRSVRRKEEAERLLLALDGPAFEDSPLWDMTKEFAATFTYASDPLLRAGGGRFFGPTALFIQQYAQHAGLVRVLHRELRSRWHSLWQVVKEALDGSVLDEPAGLPMDQVDTLHHQAFEQLIADLLDRDGYRIVRSGGGSGDQGVDVLAVDPLGNHLAVQCKHFAAGNGRVGQPVVQHLVGGAHPPRTLPIVVTNGQFVGGAKVWAMESDRARLIDRQALKLWSEDGETLGVVMRAAGTA
ncbi:restriction endonuclease [Streptomyces sp. NBC_00091]|uniref:restriction endonuclease n=1 Tax=Streptomyces sp. NBC_00091 TaxID=2975648 RepID=UPI00225269A6|nr:restriction endonuclease [Streptomyces sp. NBC_00091]MCX5380432.1 restriction endonuclease [Streptomyces sp. NBC_00091]